LIDTTIGEKRREAGEMAEEGIGCGRPTGAVVTPSGWEPGKPTLKPGPDLAGKVWKVWKP